jgi:hypothetical protein
MRQALGRGRHVGGPPESLEALPGEQVDALLDVDGRLARLLHRVDEGRETVVLAHLEVIGDEGPLAQGHRRSGSAGVCSA